MNPESKIGKNIEFVVNFGGIDTEPYEARTVSFSPQMRKVEKQTIAKIAIYKVPQNNVFRVDKFYWEVFTEQANQDLVVYLSQPSWNSFQSGEHQSTNENIPKFVTSTRLISEPGAPVQTISVAGGQGRHDNFPPLSNHLFGICYEDQIIEVSVQNQSDLYSHWLKIYIEGWSWVVKGRTKDDVLEELSRKRREKT